VTGATRSTMPVMGEGFDVPMSLLRAFAGVALTNHGQTLDALASRGGLAPCEIVALLERRRWRSMPREAAVARVRAALDPDVLEAEARRAFRASHKAICRECNREYWRHEWTDHRFGDDPFLHRLCNGDIVKL